MSTEQLQTLSVAVPKPVDGLFTYRLPESLAAQVRVGGWVKVPFGRTTTHAFIVEPPKSASLLTEKLPWESLKEIQEVGSDGAVLTEDVLKLCQWAHEYYLSPLGEVLHCAAPLAALGLKSVKKEARPIPRFEGEAFRHELTGEQKAAFEILEAQRREGAKHVALLHGVTGSGKTEIYLEMARKVLDEGKSVLLLVPEIALTSQLTHRLEQGLGTTVGLWHSAVADGKRRDLSAAVRSGEIRVLVGARSAVFAPLKDLGLIIIDEEHDPSYKQEDRVRYHARDLAVVRAKICGGFVLLGSATPSLETRERAREGKYGIARLEHRVTSAGLPTIDVLNLCTETMVEGIQAQVATRTLEQIRETLSQGEQVMVFLNRRGFAAFLLCQDCGEVQECPNCSISLTVHRRSGQLRCHVCDHKVIIPDICTKCSGDHLQAMGAGTESLEEELPKLLPEARAIRLDRDQITSNTRLEATLEEFRTGKANLLLGTQMLVKGHDFPGVTLVVVILADALFRWPDFRSVERSFQILKQVAGRSGRRDKPGKVLIQTYDPDHAVIRAVRGEIAEDTLLETERELRQGLGYPPFGRMARLRFESSSRDEAVRRSAQVAELLVPFQTEGRIEILGPSEAFLEKAKGIFRWDVLIKSPEIRSLQRAIFLTREICAKQKWQFLVDVDPYGV